MQIRFITSNQYKVDEVAAILKETGVKIVPCKIKIEELQTTDVQGLVRDKLLKAFKKIGKPAIVEHTGLYIESLKGFPGGLTQIFWDTLEAEKFCELLGSGPDTKVTAKTVVGYCDGAKIHFFEGAIEGRIAPTPKGPRGFQWDCVFIPDGYPETFAEMGDKKNDISMRKKALDAFATFLEKNRR